MGGGSEKSLHSGRGKSNTGSLWKEGMYSDDGGEPGE